MKSWQDNSDFSSVVPSNVPSPSFLRVLQNGQTAAVFLIVGTRIQSWSDKFCHPRPIIPMISLDWGAVENGWIPPGTIPIIVLGLALRCFHSYFGWLTHLGCRGRSGKHQVISSIIKSSRTGCVKWHVMPLDTCVYKYTYVYMIIHVHIQYIHIMLLMAYNSYNVDITYLGPSSNVAFPKPHDLGRLFLPSRHRDSPLPRGKIGRHWESLGWLWSWRDN